MPADRTPTDGGHRPYRRIMVYGVTGSGKTTAAGRLAARTGLPWHAVDDLTWEPGWVAVSAEEQRRRIAELVAADAWIIDHGYGQWLDLVMPRCDLIVALDYPRWRSFTRLVRRSLLNVVLRRPTCNGNLETWPTLVAHDSILRWHVRSFGSKRSRIRAWALDSPGPDIKRFVSPRQLEAWLRRLPRPVSTTMDNAVR